MPRSDISDDEFIAQYEIMGATRLAEALGQASRTVNGKRQRLEKKYGIKIKGPPANHVYRGFTFKPQEYPQRLEAELGDGIALIGSDAHYWPHRITTAHRAFVHFAKKLQPNVIVYNGDVFDGAMMSRFPLDWEWRPTVQQELEEVSEREAEVRAAAPNAKYVWTLGNHDARFEAKIANTLPELAKVQGVHLKDHFPYWQCCYSLFINNDVVIKHRFKGGIHAARNNTLWAGRSFITGHLHSLKVSPFTDLNGNRWGVDCGTLAEPLGDQFTYTEDNPKDWRSGFVVLTFKGGRLLWPEVVSVIGDGHVCFRGDIIDV